MLSILFTEIERPDDQEGLAGLVAYIILQTLEYLNARYDSIVSGMSFMVHA